MRIALIFRGTPWGWLVLLRERGRRPFSADEAAAAESLVAPLTLALKEFACRLPLHPIRRWSQPATLVVGADGELTMTTGPHGWMAFHAEAVEPDTCADVVITIQPASAELLLPVLGTWYGVTRRT